jgi:DNA-binding response OmpR family regulator
MAYLLIEEKDTRKLEMLKRCLEDYGFICTRSDIPVYNKKSVYSFDGLEIDDEKKTAKLNGKDVGLTPTEFRILSILIKNQGKVLSAEEIYSNIWNMKALGMEDNTVAVHIRRIRKKIEADPKRPHYIKAVWGSGYRVG